MVSPRQEMILRKVIELYATTGTPVGSKALAADGVLGYGASTIRHELAMLEEEGLLAHPHTSAGRIPTDAGQRYYVDRLLPEVRTAPGLGIELVQRELDEAMRVTTETLSQVTDLLAIVSAPSIDTATVRHVEVLALQPQVLHGRDHHLDRRRVQARADVRGADRPGARRRGRGSTSTSA